MVVPGLAPGVFINRPRPAAEAVTNRRRFAVRQMPADVLRLRNPWPRRRCRDEPANRAEIRGKKLFRGGFQKFSERFLETETTGLCEGLVSIPSGFHELAS